MNSLKYILAFIRVKRYNIGEFEDAAGIEKGILNSSLDAGTDPNPLAIQKIWQSFGKEMSEEGFAAIDAAAFGKTGILITYLDRYEENPFEEGTDEWTNWAIDHYLKNISE